MTETPQIAKAYGPNPPDPRWPGGARLAVQVGLSVETADGGSDYGLRAGVWRLLRMFRRVNTPVTVFVTAEALRREPGLAAMLQKQGCELAALGAHAANGADIADAVQMIAKLTGETPLGWKSARADANARAHVMAHGGFAYDCDDDSDDLPYWAPSARGAHLILPYSQDASDSAAPTSSAPGEHFYARLKDAFDVLYAEGEQTPKMLSISINAAISGRPARIPAIERFIAYASKHPDVWFARCVEIAAHWRKQHAP